MSELILPPSKMIRADGASGELTIAAAGKGKVAQVSILAYTGGQMRVEGFGFVVINLTGLTLPPLIPLLADHESNLQGIVGVGSPTVRQHQLFVQGTLSRSSPAGQQIIGLHKDGIRFEASVGVEVEKSFFVQAGKTVQVNRQTLTAGPSGLTVISKGHLREVSILPVGADRNTNVTIAARGNMTTATNQDPAGNGAGNQPDLVQQERERLQRIDHLCRGQWSDDKTVDTLRTRAINGELSIEQLQGELLVILRSGRAPVPRPVQGGRADSGQILEASICMSSGLSEEFVGKHYSQEVMNTALSAGHRGAGIHSAFLSVIHAAGLQPRGHRMDGDTIKMAFEADRMLRASFSTLSLPGILGNVANKELLATYKAVPVTWPKLCTIESNSDFKQHTRYRLVGSGQFEQIGKAGELKHITLTEQSYTSQLETWGAMISLTRQTIINDDLGAFAQVPRVLGRFSGVKVEKEVYTVLLSNPSSFFSTANNNYITGATTTLLTDGVGLTALEQKFLDQTDNNGDPIMVNPVTLLVPTTLSVNANLLTRNTQVVIAGTTDKTASAGNPHAGKFMPVSSPWLNASTLTGFSTTAWYLFADPGAGVAAMEVAFLDGKQNPTIESGDTDFQTLGMQWRAWFDFGVAMQDTRGAAKSKGAA